MTDDIADYDQAAGAVASPAPAKPRGRRTPSPNVGGRLPGWMPLAALVTALLGVVLAVIGWFKPASDELTTGHNKAEAKGVICASVGTVRQALDLATNSQGIDPAAQLAVAVNARLALYGGGGFLHDRLRAESKAPKDLKKAVSEYADTLQQLGINYLTGAAPDGPVQGPLRDQLLIQSDAVKNLCQ